ncbi:MAG: N-acetylmuramoyl-L-alanine amidase [Nitrospirae bacterium]|nr:N-acetylmuramoyl-L-alanine amidase [Nitrospirota bacterium]
MRTLFALMVLCSLSLPVNAGAVGNGLTVNSVRHASYATFTRLVFEIEAAAPYVLIRSTDGRSVTLSSYDGPFLLKTPLPMVRDSVVLGLELRVEAGRTVVGVRLDGTAGAVKDFVLRGPDRIVIDIAKGAAAPVPVPALPTKKQTVIVLDPGHGGKDTGSVASQGVEKTLALDLALAIRNSLQKDPHLKVVLTREKDQALTLDERAAASNAAGALLFVSIHSSTGTGSRVFIQDLLDEPEPQTVRPVSGDFLGYEAGSEQKELLWGRQQAAHARESGVLGRELARQLVGQDSAEPVQAPLALLKAVDAAAVMIETGMDTDRAQAAAAIVKGIERYVREN